MSDQPTSEANFIDVDLDQWRRDIQTFASATHEALDAIVGDLSSVIGGGSTAEQRSNRSLQTSRLTHATPRSTTSTATRSNKSAARPQGEQMKTSAQASVDAAPANRLASIKEKLALRMAKP